MRPLYFLNKFLGLSIRDYNNNMRLSKFSIAKSILSFLIYLWGFVQVFYLFETQIFIENTPPVIRIGNIIESITSFVFLLILYSFTISQELKRAKTWSTIMFIDQELSSIGIQVSFNKLSSFTAKTTFLTIGILSATQWYQSVVQGYFLGILGYACGMQTTVPLLVTFAAVLQFQCILFLLCERFELINKNLEHILKFRHGSEGHRIKYLSEFKFSQPTPTPVPNKTKTRKKYQNSFTTPPNKSFITAFNSDPTLRLKKLLKILMHLLEWTDQIKSTYEIPMLLCIQLLFITAVFKMYLAATKFQKMVHGLDFETVNTYMTTLANQSVIHVAILMLIHLIETCAKKVNNR